MPTRLSRQCPRLLSQVNGKPTRPGAHDNRSQEQEVDHNEAKDNSQKLKQEPATDDEPLSSSEEEEEEEEGEEVGKEVGKDEEAIDSPVQAKKEGTTKRKRKERDSPASNKSQKSNPPPDEGFQSVFQPPRKKGMDYTNSSSQSVRSSQSGFKQPTNIDIKDIKPKNDGSFQVPLNIHFKSSPPSQNTSGPPTAIHEQAFRMPWASEDSAISPVGQFGGPAIRQDILRAPTSSSLTFREFDINDDDDISSLSSPTSDIYEAMEKLDDDSIAAFQQSPTKDTETDGQSRCPNCNTLVDADLLGEFLALPGRRLRDERLFCERHKAHNAEKEWTDKGYPTIDWHTFDKRVQRHFSELEGLLVPSPSSFFRGRLESTMKAGQAKVFKLSLEEDNLENLSCGYYGPKGASRMLNSVTSKYSRKLRQLATMDNVLKTAGPTTYAQAVLVPELTVLLIKEDMNVDSQDARQILRDSMDVGIRLNAAEDDQIHIEETEEDNNYT